MGFGLDSFRFLLSAEKMGFSGKHVCTLGRQAMTLPKAPVRALLNEYGKNDCAVPDKAMCFADDYLTPLGFIVDAMDASDYEGADIIHDLNKPIPDDLCGRYDLVWDGGTLEHVFNFPVAIQSVMQMAKVGGHVFIETPCNNQCGHGFYQFSPELYFRLFTPENGFEILRVIISSKWLNYHVVDPNVVRGRVELRNDEGALMRVHARKIADAPLSSIQQSDYTEAWQHSGEVKSDGRLKSILRKALSENQIRRTSFILNRLRLKRAIKSWKANSKLTNRSWYAPVTDWSVKSSDCFPR